METNGHRPKKSVRRALALAQRPPRPVPQHVHIRQVRERRIQQLIIAGAVFVLLLVFLIPGYGYWRNVLHLGAEPIVTVEGETITTEEYARYLGTRQELLNRQITQLQAALPTATPTRPVPTSQPGAAQPAASVTPGGSPTPGAVTTPSPAEQTLQSLLSEQSSLSTTALTDLIEARIVVHEARARGLTASPSELDDALRWLMSPPATSTPSSYGLTPAPEHLSRTGVLSLAQAQDALNRIVGSGRFLSADQIRQEILEPAVLKRKLLDAFASSVPRETEQVHARHILVNTEAEAKAIRQQLLAGADFAALAKKSSIDPGTKDKGGDLGWFGRGVMDPAFEKAAFSLKVGEISEPVKTSFGYHIIQVLARDPHRPLTPDQIRQQRDRAYEAWLGKVQADPKQVSYALDQNKMTWVANYVIKGN